MEVPISGHCEARFAAVREAFVANFLDQGEVGAAVTVLLRGEPIVELVGGWRDASCVEAWQRDTVVNVYSVGKAFVALLLLQLVDKGEVRLDDPIASVWPEFVGKGKGRATVRQALCHQAGVPAIRQPLTNADLWRWDTMTSALAATEPWWEAGERHAYHTNTFGHLIGEPVHRITGQLPGRPCARWLPPRRRSLVRPTRGGAPPVRGGCVVDRRGSADGRLGCAHRRRTHGSTQLLQSPGLLVDGGGEHS